MKTKLILHLGKIILLAVPLTLVAISGCSKTPAAKNTSLLGVNIGDSQQTVLELHSNPKDKYTSKDKTYESWYYPYKHDQWDRIKVSRRVNFQEASGKLKVDLLECKWDDPEVHEEGSLGNGILENLWYLAKPCEIQGVGIYSTESEVIKTFGQPEAKLLIPNISNSKAITSLSYDGIVFHLYKKRVFEIYAGSSSSISINAASVFYEYPVEVLEKIRR